MVLNATSQRGASEQKLTTFAGGGADMVDAARSQKTLRGGNSRKMLKKRELLDLDLQVLVQQLQCGQVFWAEEHRFLQVCLGQSDSEGVDECVKKTDTLLTDHPAVIFTLSAAAAEQQQQQSGSAAEQLSPGALSCSGGVFTGTGSAFCLDELFNITKDEREAAEI
ncbi:hypothetical protein INR49_020531, partial [Caranx melampygus]